MANRIGTAHRKICGLAITMVESFGGGLCRARGEGCEDFLFPRKKLGRAPGVAGLKNGKDKTFVLVCSCCVRVTHFLFVLFV